LPTIKQCLVTVPTNHPVNAVNLL